MIGLSESQMQASIVILTNESATATVQIPSVKIAKLKPTYDNLFVFSDSEDDDCIYVDISNTSLSPFKIVHSTLRNFLYM